MSKFAKTIDAVITGDRKLLPMKYSSIKLETHKDHVTSSMGVYTAVKIGAKFESIVYIDDYDLTRNPDAIRQALVSIKRAMVEEMFGEFRPLLMDALAATYDTDQVRLRTALANLEKEMFQDGI